MTVDRGPNSADATRLACTKHYRDALAWHQANQALLAAGDPAADAPPFLVMLGVDPVQLVERALNAELYNPVPKTDLGKAPNQ